MSIVVLTYQRRGELLGNLERLLRRNPGVPVIVVDNGSRDGTADAVAAAYPGVTLVRAPGNLGAAGRNLGVAVATTPYIAFCDDDTCWEVGALAEAQRLLDGAPRAGVINAAVRVGPSGRLDATCLAMSRSPLGRGPLGTTRLLGFMAGACVVRRQAYLQAGGYEARYFIGGEEALMALDLATLGWDMLYAGQVATWHYPSPNRDRPGRRRLLSRNDLWTAWLRLPAGVAWAATWTVLRECRQHGDALRVLGAALAGAAWILRARRCISAAVECQRQRVANTVTAEDAVLIHDAQILPSLRTSHGHEACATRVHPGRTPQETLMTMHRDTESRADEKALTDHSGDAQDHAVLRPDTGPRSDPPPRSLQNRPLDPNSSAEKTFPPGVDAADVLDPGRQTPGAPPVDNRSGQKR
ncbi:glycosyltransferase family 2 protein [Bordetella genomosp. 8]|uniref:glycosyltransferase family 2 protein n=1 Tax=Bordetella genomosp. 8 TaxID=1416806 RepID=UPI000A31F1B6|nr:glycosyltransferase [Bordetella genomosp. 8]